MDPRPPPDPHDASSTPDLGRPKGDAGPSGSGSSIREGTNLGDLTLLHQLGRGGQGVVFAAHQESLDRTVAVKILPKERIFTQEQRERFHREAEAAGRLHHGNIVSIYGFDEWDGHPLIIQELVEGGSLQAAIEEHEGSGSGSDAAYCAWAAEICRQLADGLQHAHENSVIHRDMKPGNVLLDNQTPKIADFGLARLEDRAALSRTGAMMGTPHYMSPEQVAGAHGGLDHRTDIYSLGTVLYRMLAHRVPFFADSRAGIFMDILTRAPTPPRSLDPGVDPDLEAVCLKAMEKSAENRYRSARDFADDLGRYLRGDPTLARPVGPLGHALRAMRRLPVTTLVLVALLVPTLWLLVDLWWIRGLMQRDLAVYAWRQVLVALTGLGVAWPLGVLGRRLAQGRLSGALSGWLLSLALALSLGCLVEDQRRRQIQEDVQASTEVLRERMAEWQAEDRRSLLRSVNTSGQRSVEVLDAYAERWDGRLTPSDLFLLSRGFLSRGRLSRAERWARRLEQAADHSVLTTAMLLAIQDAQGNEPQVASLESRLWSWPDDGSSRWGDWHGVGRLFQRELRRHQDALRAYDRAARMDGADRDALNVSMAHVLLDLCRADEARERLTDLLRFRPNDLEVIELSLRIAVEDGDEEKAKRLLDRLETHQEAGTFAPLVERHGTLLAFGRLDEANQLARRALEGSRDNAQVVSWCGQVAYQDAMRHLARARSHAAAGDAEPMQIAVHLALESFEYARELYLQADALTLGRNVEARLGLSAISTMLATHGDPARRMDRMEAAIAEARTAIAFDETYFEAHYNLAQALGNRLWAIHGSLGAIPEEGVREVVAAYVAAVECGALEPRSLNNLAVWLGELFRHSGEWTWLEQAVSSVRRGIALETPDPESRCALTEERRIAISRLRDTESTLHELAGDWPTALASAQLALDVLEPGDGGPSVWDRRVARLEALRDRAR